MNIGLVGCGAMGSGMAQNILKSGHSVYVHDDMSKWRKQLEKQGVKFVDLNTLVQEARYILLSLPSPQILEDLMLGDDGMIAHLPAESFIFDLGTTDVQTTQMIHTRAAEKGIHYLDCPVSGGPAGAAAGTLTIVAGGDTSGFQRAKFVLDIVGQKITYVGEAGTAQAIKLCNNMLVAGITALLSETMTVAGEHGISNQMLADMIQQSSGQNKVLNIFGENLVNKEFDNVLFYLEHMAKDLEHYMELSTRSKTPQYVTSTVNQLYRSALQKGKGRQDSTAVYSVISE